MGRPGMLVGGVVRGDDYEEDDGDDSNDEDD